MNTIIFPPPSSPITEADQALRRNYLFVSQDMQITYVIWLRVPARTSEKHLHELHKDWRASVIHTEVMAYMSAHDWPELLVKKKPDDVYSILLSDGYGPLEAIKQRLHHPKGTRWARLAGTLFQFSPRLAPSPPNPKNLCD